MYSTQWGGKIKEFKWLLKYFANIIILHLGGGFP